MRIIFCFLFSVLIFGNTVAQQLAPELIEQVKKAQQQHQIPAISVSLITPDSVFSYVNGKSRIGKKEKITSDAKFHLGSNSKAITAFIAMHLREQGLIGWQTRFFDLFPELETSSQKAYASVTLDELLSHNAQIRPYTSGIEMLKFNNLKGSTSEKRYTFSKSVLTEKPVKKGTYSNAGYILAAAMLEKASGKSFKTLLDEVMSDLDLDYYIGFPNEENSLNPWGHWVENQTLVSLGPDHEYKLLNFMASAGDIAMNTADYSRFIQLNLQGLLGKSNYLSSENYQKLHFGSSPYAYGWGNLEKADNRMSYHDGSAGTYYCHTVLNPDHKIAVVIMMNTATDEAVAAIYEIQKWMSAHPQKSKN